NLECAGPYAEPMPSLPCAVAFSLVDLKTFGLLALRSSPFYLVHPGESTLGPTSSFSKIIGEEPRIGRLILKELDAMLSENSRAFGTETECSFSRRQLQGDFTQCGSQLKIGRASWRETCED